MMKPIILFFLVFIVLGQSAQIPPYFKRCDRSKPDFKECLAEAVQNALPQLTKPVKSLGIPSLVPLEIAEVNIEIGRDNTKFVQKLKNCKIYGLDKPDKVRTADIDFKQHTLKMEIMFPEMKSLCQYSMEGKILVFPIEGQGNSLIAAKNFDVFMNLTYSERVKDGNTYIEFDKNGTIDGLIEGMQFQLDNLFNGDKQLGDRMNQLLNENWKEFFAEVKTDYLRAFLEIFVTIGNRVFTKLSMEEAFDE